MYDHQVDLRESFGTGRNVINTAMSNLDWGRRLALGVYLEVRERNSASFISTPVALLIIAIAANLFFN